MKKRNLHHTDELPDGQRFIILAHTPSGYRMLGSTSSERAAEQMALNGFEAGDVDWVTTLVPLGIHVK